MKKGVILAIVAVAAAAAPALAGAFHNHRHEQGVNNTVCIQCGGTGRSWGPGGKGTGMFRCNACKGSGFYGSY